MTKYNTDYPICFKNEAENHFYKINSKDEFEELRINPTTFFYHLTNIHQHPERLYLQDLLQHLNLAYTAVPEAEFFSKLTFARKNLKELRF